MFLNCPEEVFRYIGRTFESAFLDPTVAAQLAQQPARVRLGLIDPDCVLVIDTEHREVRLGSSQEKSEVPTAMVAMNADTAIRYFQGQLDFRSAVASGEIAASGEVEQFFDLLGDRASLPRLYAEVMRRAGREDLLAA